MVEDINKSANKLLSTNTWRLIVADDEPLSRTNIKNILSQRHPDFVVIAEAASIYSAQWPCDHPKYIPPAFDLLNSCGRVDGIILDINFDREPKNVAIDFALAVSRLPQAPWVIFMTGMLENARKAHGVHAIDFWDKPFDDAKIDITLDWVRRNKPPFKEKRLPIKHKKINRIGESEWCTRVVDIVDIRYIHKDTNANTSHVRLVKGEILDGINLTVADWETRLCQHDFVRVNRSCIANSKLIVGTRTSSSGKLFATFADSSDEVPISPDCVDKLYETLYI